MQLITHELTLDFKRINTACVQVIDIYRGDANSHQLRIKLKSDGLPFSLPSGLIMAVEVGIENKLGLPLECTLTDDVLTCILTEEALLIPGMMYGQVAIKNGDAVLSSSAFRIRIVDRVMNQVLYPNVPGSTKHDMDTALAEARNLSTELDTKNTASQGLISSLNQAIANADEIKTYAFDAQNAKNTAIEKATIAVNKAEQTASDKQITETNRELTTQNAQTAQEAMNQTIQAEQRVIQLMSTDTKSYFFATIAERDAADGIRDCDRCSVLETRADYIYDTHDLDGNDVNPEWIKTSEWDALKTVAWEIITGKPNFAAVATTGSFYDLVDAPAKFDAPVVLDNTTDTITWNLNDSYNAVVTLTQPKPLTITNFYNGCVCSIHCYGSTLDFSDTAQYQLSANFGFLEPVDNEHMMYVLNRCGTKWIVSAVPVGGEEYE